MGSRGSQFRCARDGILNAPGRATISAVVGAGFCRSSTADPGGIGAAPCDGSRGKRTLRRVC